MFYYDTEEKKSKLIGVAAAALYILFWFVLMLLVKYSFEVKDSGEGLLISFGDSEFATGMGDPEAGITMPEAHAATQEDTGELLTQDFEDAPVIHQEENRNITTPADVTREEPREVVPQERVADPRLSFPGTTQGATSNSQGTATTGTGVQGAPDGSELGSPDGTGFGSQGVGFDLSGRSVVGTLPPPSYKEGDEGTVVVEVVVRADGTVKSARRVSNNRDPNNAGKRVYTTTVNDGRLIREAESVARRSRFDNIQGDTEQIGWLIYRFNLR